MEQTPLELYETAYRLHYSEHRIDDAVTYYKRLIKEFPEANECGYAVIQLQKIKATEVAEDLSSVVGVQKASKTSLPIVLIICLVALAGAVFYLLIENSKINKELVRTGLALNALSKMSRGNHEGALELLVKMKSLTTDDIFPYELSADIFRKDKKYEYAKDEYATFYKLNPTIQPTENERWFMEYGNDKKVRLKPPAEDPVPAPEPPPLPARKTTAKKSRKKVNTVPPPPGKPRQGLFLVDPDSISYF